MGSSRHIGRVGALAVALGVGCAVAAPAGIAWAETADTAGSPSGPTSNAESASSPGTQARNESGESSGQHSEAVNSASTADTSGSNESGSNDTESGDGSRDQLSPSAQTTEVAPGVTVSSSGGAQSSTETDAEDDANDEDAGSSRPSRRGRSDTDRHETDRHETDDASGPAPEAQTRTVRGENPTNSDDDGAVERDVIAVPAASTFVMSSQETRTVALAPPPSIVTAVLSTVVAPIFSNLLAAIPGVPADSPLGWILLAASRRQFGKIEQPTEAVRTMTAEPMLMAAVTDGTNTVPAVVNIPVSAAPIAQLTEIGAVDDAHAVVAYGERAYVTNRTAGTVTVIDTTTNSVLRTLAVGALPDEMVIRANGAGLYVISRENNTVTLVSTATGATTATVQTPNPSAIAISSSGYVYITNYDAGTVSRLNPVYRTIDGVLSLPAGTRPTEIAVNPGKAIYVAGVDSAGQATLTVVNAAFTTSSTFANLPSPATGLAVSPDTKRLYVSSTDGNVTVFDTTTNAMLGTYNVGGSLAGITVSKDGSLLTVVDTRGQVSALDASSGTVLKTVATRTSTTEMSVPPGMTVGADGTRMYVTDYDADKVYVVSLVPTNPPQAGTPTVGAPNATTGAVAGTVGVTDADGDPLNYTVTTAPAKGTLVVTSTGAFTYTPTAAARHAAAKLDATAADKLDTFTITVDDGHGGVVPVSLTVPVGPANAIPTAATLSGSSTDLTTGTVTGTVNATDADNDPLSYTATAATKGVLTMQSDGTFTYTPTTAAREAAAVPDAPASDKTETVTVIVADGYGGTSSSTLALTISPLGTEAPTNEHATVNDPTSAIGMVTGTVIAADPNADTLTFTLDSAPTTGLVKLDAVTGAFTYVPNVEARYAAAATPGIDTDVFTVRINDVNGGSMTVQVHVQVAPPAASSIDQRSTTVAIAAPDMYFYTQAELDKAFEVLQASGVNTIRVMLPWAGIEPANNAWRWIEADRLVNTAAAHNIEILAVLNSTPGWAVVPGMPALNGRPASPAEFAQFTGVVATRYQGKIAAYEVWNEPNGLTFWAPAPSAAQYTELLKAAYPAIKAADPDAVVVAAGLGAVIDFGSWTVNPVRFVKEMYAAGAAGYFDALAFHPYLYNAQFSQPNWHPDTPANQAKRIYQLMVANGDGNKKIWATEYGQPSAYAGEATQDAYLGDFLRTWRDLDYAGPAFIHTLRDYSSSSVNASSFGLFRSDWTPKPAADTVAQVVQENQALLAELFIIT